MQRRALRVLGVVGFGLLLLVGCTGTTPATDTTTPPASSTSGGPSTSTPKATTAAGSSSPTTTGTNATATSSAGTSTGPAEITPVLAAVTTQPIPVTGTDGKTYLVYELYLTNTTSKPVTIDSVQAVDTDSGAVLQTHASDNLVAHSRVVGAAPDGTPATSVVLNGGQLAIIWLDPNVTPGSPLPTSVAHQVKLTFATAPNPLVPAELTENVAVTPVQTTPAPTIKPPLEGQNWLDGDGCCDEVTPHRGAANPIDGRYFFAQRFAIDWVQLTSDRQLATGDVTQLSSYPYYGAPIHAVADGTVVAVSDVLQDQVPGSNPPAGTLTLDQYDGNHVVQRFEQNGHTYYAFYAHLKPGSTKDKIAVGQTVRAGDVLGELGNSGNTDAPHLHFHLMDGPDPLASNGLPFQFDQLTLVGHASGDDAIESLQSGQPFALASDSPTGQRAKSMPLYLDLVDLTPTASTATLSSTPSGSSSTGSSSTGSSSKGQGSSSPSASTSVSSTG